MARIRRDWGDAIEEACRYSSVPPVFLAALIGNESGGNARATRFEPVVYKRLNEVRNAPPEARAHYGGMTSEVIRRALADARASDADSSDALLRDWATSWGLTQIMGYHLVDSGARTPNSFLNPRALLEPRFNLRTALRLLGEFVERYQLDPRLEYAELFRCWNTGSPYGKTFDPQYVDRGLARMRLYARESERGEKDSSPEARP